jgi:hypothetical protein
MGGHTHNWQYVRTDTAGKEVWQCACGAVKRT